MANIGAAATGLSQASTSLLTTGTVETLTLTSADTEYSYTFPPLTKALTIHGRGVGLLRLAFAPGQIALGEYLSIPSGGNYARDGIGSALTTICLSSPIAGLVVELESWV